MRPQVRSQPVVVVGGDLQLPYDGSQGKKGFLSIVPHCLDQLLLPLVRELDAAG